MMSLEVFDQMAREIIEKIEILRKHYSMPDEWRTSYLNKISNHIKAVYQIIIED